ncbi:MAG: carbohydrate porin [Deltaproteobacteria bacterium]|nr:carbohydrate porin [Deltaproteobacteria bacterium]
MEVKEQPIQVYLIFALFVFFGILFLPVCLKAVELTDKVSISGDLTLVNQWLDKSKGDVPNKDRGSAVIDLNLSIRPTSKDELFGRISFAEGSGFHSPRSRYPFILSSNADNLYIDLRDINGHSRDYLLEVWYSRMFEPKKDGPSFKLTGGILDSPRFIDDNRYANDEIGQFMNETFVNNPVANLPSSDWGLAMELEWKSYSFKLVGMRSKNENEEMDRKKFNWFGMQLGYKLDIGIGEGNYRVYAYTTDKKFENWRADAYKALRGFGVSFDQEIIRETLGAFVRAGWQDDSARVDYTRMFSLGLNLSGILWGRKKDEIGLGYAYLKSPTKHEDLKKTHVLEGYIKFQLATYRFINSDLTLDYQYIKDKAREIKETRAGHIYGARLNISF